MPTIVEQLEDDMKQAMRDRDRPRLSAIRMMRSALQNAAIAKGPNATIDDTEAADVLAREARQRKESIDEFRKAGREDGLEDQEAELAVVLAYLPERLSRDEIEAEARKIIDDIGARSMTDRGRVMGALMPVMKGRADGKDVSDVVQQLLSQ
ncbi:MAG: GatB/YqeY domain-containing protein [Chloroflexi bacterium]|nr:GatB/YqeY domain-containing protein [Chloroflexota bacterium]